jgi:hypothetical protein
MEKLLPQFLAAAIVSTLIFMTSATFSLVNIDRSRSFYVLSWVDRGLVSNVDGKFDLSRVMSDEKWNLKGIESRFFEQISRGLITSQGPRYRLTKMGFVYLKFAEISADIFKLKNWESNKL